MKNIVFRLLITFSLLLWTVACTTSLNPTTADPTSTEMIFTQPVLSTSTETMQPSFPTLTAEEANTEIQRLLSNEQGCSFPCWWDLTPGQTQVVDVINFLDSLSVFSIGAFRLNPEEGYILLIMPQSQDSYLHLTFVYKGRKEILERLWLRIQSMHKVTYPDGSSSYEVSWGDPLLAEILRSYNLSQVLSKYGMPSEVLIRTHQAALLNQPWPISLIVYYPEQGFMIEYVADGMPAPNNNIGWCPSLAFPIFWFWTPSNEITMLDVVSEIPGEQIDRESLEAGNFKTIVEATGMSIEEFYSLFKNNEDKCVETPTNLWPMPGQ
jgi:hypothetical protein